MSSLFPLADYSELLAALPRRNIQTIQRKASDLGIKRQTSGTRTNKRLVHHLIRQLRAKRENRKMSRATVGKRAGYHENQILGWELGKTNPDLRFFCEWAQALGFELILRPTMTRDATADIIPWPDRKRLMAGR